jgi:hypothetical protein
MLNKCIKTCGGASLPNTLPPLLIDFEMYSTSQNKNWNAFPVVVNDFRGDMSAPKGWRSF